MFEVRFIHADGGMNEEYFYANEEAARDHYECFRNDDSNLYLTIQLIDHRGEKETIMDKCVFGLSEWDVTMFATVADRDQFDTCFRLMKLGEVFVKEADKDMITELRMKIVRLSEPAFASFVSMFM